MSEIAPIRPLAENVVRMTQLAHTFPSMRGIPGATKPFFDATTLLKVLCEGGLSHGERCAARFLLNVWNASTDWVKEARALGLKHAKTASRFDLTDAMGVWGADHVAALQGWIARPYWP